MKIKLHKKDGEELSIQECIVIIVAILSTYGFLGWFLYLLWKT